MLNALITRRGAAALTVLITLALPGTAAAQRSVDEAIKVIDSFRSDAKTGAATPVSFVPPPRTIADITAILDKQKPDPARRAASTARADGQPAAGLAPQDLADFYFQRSLSAMEIGRAQQSLDDVKKAYEIGSQANSAPARLMQYLQSIGASYLALGDMKNGIATQHQRLQLSQRMDGGFGQAVNSHSMLANLHSRAGQIDTAREAVAAAEKMVANAPPRMPQHFKNFSAAQVHRARGALALATGRAAEAETAYREALATLAQIIPIANNIGIPLESLLTLRDNFHIDIGTALARQNRLVEAEAEVRRALLNRLERNGRYAANTATDVSSLANILFDQGRYAESEKLADAARETLEALGHGKGSTPLAAARALVARSQAAQGKGQEQRATYAALAQDLADNAELRARFLDRNIGYAISLMNSGQLAEAIRITENAAETNRRTLGDKAFPTAQARGWLAAALARQGNTARAASEFEAATEILLASSRQADDADDDGASVGQQDRQTQRIVEIYLGLLADTKGSAAAAETFRLADAIRGKSVQRALAASAARASTTDPALANLVRYEQDAQKQAAALQGLLTNILTRPTSEQDAGAVQKLRKDIDSLRTARARLREEIERRFPDYVNLIDPRPVTVEQAQKSLKPGEALIATYAGDERLFVWAIPHQGPAAYASSKVTDKEMEKMVTELRKALDPNADTLESVPAFDVALANRLYELLLKPVEAGWKDARSLMVVPHKALGQLPTAVLVTEKIAQPAKAGVFFAEYKNVPFLARKVAVTQLPSVASLATLRSLPAPAANRDAFVAFGDPWFSPEQANEARQQVAMNTLQTRGRLVRRNAPKTEGVDSAELAMLPRLPDTAEEVKSIALALSADLSKDVFTGEAANEKTVKSMDLSKRKIVMFATHGLVPGDLNGLTQPALAMTAPGVAKVDGDGLLTMEEVLALKLNADWVVLSACNTATGSGAGAEAVSGLGRAFFYAGTRALLVSNWPVETVSARTLTTDLFRRQAENPGLARGEAMRQAEVALIDGPGAIDEATKQPMFSYAHPIFWAPFSVVGDGG